MTKLVRVPVFPGSQVSRMIRFAVFPGSQVTRMVCFPIFPSSQVLKMLRFPVFLQVLASISIWTTNDLLGLAEVWHQYYLHGFYRWSTNVDCLNLIWQCTIGININCPLSNINISCPSWIWMSIFRKLQTLDATCICPVESVPPNRFSDDVTINEVKKTKKMK